MAEVSMIEEGPFELVPGPGPGSGTSLLFLCDHASRAVPPELGHLGLDPALFATHIASDIGAAEVTRALAARFAAPAILARWSRLVVDLNRGEDDPTLVMKLSDGSIVPGNRHADVAARIARFHRPYHARIAATLDGMANVPVLVSMHSFTPVWKGRARPWQVGVLWDRDRRLAGPLIEELDAAGFTVGDNEPYSGELEGDTLYRHGTLRGVPHALIEIRQDLIGDDAAARVFAERLAPILERALARLGGTALHFTRPLGANGMDEKTREALEAAAFRRLVAHLRTRSDVQNIDLMTLAGFCRNCLGDWYREAAAERGIALDKDAARETVYGMPVAEWKARYQTGPTQKTHS